MRILIVEDEIRIREGIKGLLSKIDPGYEVMGEAENGKQGLELCQSLSPELIITDVQMPEMDGLQMLQAIYDKGFGPKAIVLSAYSEFEYARGAMKLGVTEYLLKPINLNEFSQALENITHQMETDRQKKPDQVGTLDQIMRDGIEGRMMLDDETKEYLSSNYGIGSDRHMILLVAYLGNQYEESLKTVKNSIRHSLLAYGNIDFSILESDHRKSLFIIVYNYEHAKDLERWVQYQLLGRVNDLATMGFIEVDGLGGLKEGLDRLFPYMDWNISLEDDILISYPQITKVQNAMCVYPKDVETQIKSAVCASDHDKEEELIKKFADSFRDGKIYDPHEIKECYVRFIWAVIEISKDVGNTSAGNIRQQKLLEQIMNSKTREELSEICGMILDVLKKGSDQVDSDNLIVKRAKSMIHEFYHTGITLDEIATRLNITPEYLGTQFHKDTGTTFSAYIKNYRISKAKELLVGTSLKLYEIADRVGYSDPKYFSKVFREMTGQLPAEYRKTSK